MFFSFSQRPRYLNSVPMKKVFKKDGNMLLIPITKNAGENVYSSMDGTNLLCIKNRLLDSNAEKL